MAIDPVEWLATAQHLATMPGASGADLRRAVSTAYYALFHHLLKTATERFVTADLNSSYRAFYRTFDHTRMRLLCERLNTEKLPDEYAPALGSPTVSKAIREFAQGFVDLQRSRHVADYNPIYQPTAVDSCSTVQLAEDAIEAFERINVRHQNIILLYMLLPPLKREA